MSKPSLAIIALITSQCASLVWAQSNATPQLPDGPLKAKVVNSCTECHDARIILQQRLTKASWAREVEKMTKWGAVVEPADRDFFIDYLSGHFSPDKPSYQAPRSTK
ncbi:MAG: hypothetical protein JO266_10150 [Acidobacteria bacterium]|nr:hypothetical protein [Acidobacteriota bacterium]MBV8892312.1 hypothetical protein [Acidobacteriota bacterium]MBV9479658.1 hypothetical protein [Acidobacteriota bacterium]